MRKRYGASVATFSEASWAKTYSFPSRRAGSPVQRSSEPSVAKSTPAAFRILTSAWLVLRARGSVAPAQPTQSRYSTSRPPSSLISGTPSPSAHSIRRSGPRPQGLPLVSSPLKAFVASCGKLDSIITWLCRRATSVPGTESISTGQAWTQAAQVVQAQSSSSWTWPTPRACVISGAFWSRRLSLTSWSTFIGWSGLPVACAGQTELQRPHSVHANESSRAFHGSSRTWLTPNVSVLSKSIRGGRP